MSVTVEFDAEVGSKHTDQIKQGGVAVTLKTSVPEVSCTRCLEVLSFFPNSLQLPLLFVT